MSNAIRAAKDVFDDYAGMDAGKLPADPWSALQVMLSRWETRNFGAGTLAHRALGVCEEAGELAHAILKHEQGIRGMGDRDAMREAAGDAIADVTIYAINLATALRLDFGTLVRGVAEQVMGRDWKKGGGA